MALFEDRVLTDTIEINTTPENVFQFLTSIVDSESYQAWHKEDHVAFRFIKGEPWVVGSVIHAEEYIHGKLHKLKFIITARFFKRVSRCCAMFQIFYLIWMVH